MSHRMTPLVGALATPGHWQAFEALLREYAVRDLAQPQLSTIWRDLENLPARYAAPSGRAILLQVDGDLAGCIGLAATRVAGACEIKRLYVRHPHRGKGWGTVLMRGALEHAREAGYDQAVLSTWPDNPKALALYASMGFVTIVPFKDSPDQDLVYLGCPLGPGRSQDDLRT